MSNKRILIVDDEPSICAILKRGLEKMGVGYQVTTAGDGSEALDYIKKQPFDLIVTDYKMAHMDGLTLLEHIRQIRPNVRVILMTAYGSNQVEKRAHRLNAYKYLTKPLEMDDFRHLVQEALGDMAVSSNGMLILSDHRFQQAAQSIKSLMADVGACCILLVDVLGQTIIRQGKTKDLPINEIVTLLGSGIATLNEAGQSLDGETDTINLIYRESKHYNLYGINVGQNLLLVILIPISEYSSSLGSVWYYAGRTVKDLKEIVGDVSWQENIPNQKVDSDFGEMLGQELDTLFGIDDTPSPEKKHVSGRLLSMEEAIQKGLLVDVPEHLLKGDAKT